MPNNEHTYRLRHQHQFKTPSVNTVYHGTKSVSFLGPNVWEILPDSFKKIDNIHGNLVIALADFAGYMFKTLVFSNLY